VPRRQPAHTPTLAQLGTALSEYLQQCGTRPRALHAWPKRCLT